ncbi:hypothetical protein EVA_12282 [gut metagenome]|uniref:Uncharacterized protein n=1 Tax=gut metagenome TaxID=749906 RepID=J9GCX8_9ZZZZ
MKVDGVVPNHKSGETRSCILAVPPGGLITCDAPLMFTLTGHIPLWVG